mmetsp:Transcript_54659/g.175291  ORF Transcript_54659/g.175291 Transcript_54659/m.175291 type:complete len:205 (-) Transcript_54659:492-1106(-)
MTTCPPRASGETTPWLVGGSSGLPVMAGSLTRRSPRAGQHGMEQLWAPTPATPCTPIKRMPRRSAPAPSPSMCTRSRPTWWRAGWRTSRAATLRARAPATTRPAPRGATTRCSATSACRSTRTGASTCSSTACSSRAGPSRLRGTGRAGWTWPTATTRPCRRAASGRAATAGSPVSCPGGATSAPGSRGLARSPSGRSSTPASG